MTFTITINGKELIAFPGQTILQVAEENGIEIPTLCYDKKVHIYGACGACLVEAEGNAKLLRACATEATTGMVIHTESERAVSARKMALELMLSDHTGDCRPPCREACPGLTDCQGYVGLIANGQYQAAVEVIKEQLPLPASIGRVCPHPCEDACRRQMVEEPISIAWLKSFAADMDLAADSPYLPDIAEASSKTVAIIGAGPAGLTAAYFLAKEGHRVEIFEAMPAAGGMLRYGIPEYRLPKEVLDKEIALIENMGVIINCNVKIGRDTQFSDLKDHYDAVFIAIGAWQSSDLGSPGQELKGVLGGIDFLIDVVQGHSVNMGEKVAVVGGGNTAMDACRTAVRLGAKEVYILYRRTREEMPAAAIEITEAIEEGVDFRFLVAPIEVLGDSEGKVTGIRLQKMALGEPDASGRRRPVAIEGEEEILELDTVIAAIGQKVVPDGIEVDLTRWNTIIADANTFQTNIEGVFAGGDAINNGPGIAIEAIGHARRAAQTIDNYLRRDNNLSNSPPSLARGEGPKGQGGAKGEMSRGDRGASSPLQYNYIVTQNNLTKEDFTDEKVISRPHMAHMSPEERKTNFREIVYGYTKEQAQMEAARCLECGCADFFECKLIQYGNQYDVQPERLIENTRERRDFDNHPFIERNVDKCILCGLCVRICDEVVGATALGLVNRGFDTLVQPEFMKSLRDTDCISCGQCVNACPTGALLEKWPGQKRVPLAEELTPSVCAYCSIGCNTIIASKEDMLCRVLPDNRRGDSRIARAHHDAPLQPAGDKSVVMGKLCVRGRFGAGFQLNGERVIAPYLPPVAKATSPLASEGGKKAERGNTLPPLLKGGCHEVTGGIAPLQEAAQEFAKKAQEIISRHGTESFGIAIGDKLTMEDMYLAEKLGRTVIGTPHIGCFNKKPNAMTEAFGIDRSLNTFAEIGSADCIIYVGGDIMKLHPVLGMELKKAAGELVIISDEDSLADNWASLKIKPQNDLTILKEILTDKYITAKRPLLIFDEQTVSYEAAKLLTSIAVQAGQTGIIQLKPKNNSQALPVFGIKDRVALNAALPNLHALLVIGEDVSDLNRSNPELLVVMDSHITETMHEADIVFPLAPGLESEGHFINSEGRVQHLSPAFKPLSGYENRQILTVLANSLGANWDYTSIDCVTEDMIADNALLSGMRNEKEFFWPDNQRIIAPPPADGYSPRPFGPPPSQAKGASSPLQDDGMPLFEKLTLTDCSENALIAFLEKEGIN
jgi:formate dehydrogenase major subunit